MAGYSKSVSTSPLLLSCLALHPTGIVHYIRIGTTNPTPINANTGREAAQLHVPFAATRPPWQINGVGKAVFSVRYLAFTPRFLYRLTPNGVSF